MKQREKLREEFNKLHIKTQIAKLKLVNERIGEIIKQAELDVLKEHDGIIENTDRWVDKVYELTISDYRNDAPTNLIYVPRNYDADEEDIPF